jgi:serine/threonine-protein kinase
VTNEIEFTLPFRTGELIAGKYRMDSVLGAGGMGVVLAATHLDLDRKVAVKVIRPELSADEALVQRLLLEARSAAKIRGEHVGRVLDVGRLEGGTPFIVMEYLEGQDLGALLQRRGPLSIIQATDLILQACEAVAEAHAAQIVHRDLKPENLFVTTTPDGSPCVKVLDFGISKQLGDSTQRALTNPTTAIGSPQYMAPEQMKAEDIDTRVDVWALGAILYEALSGRKAFDAPSLPAVCAQVLSTDPPPLGQLLPSVPAALESVVQRCLQKDPAARFASVTELAKALAPFGSSRAGQSYRRIRALSSGRVSSADVLADPDMEAVSSYPAHAAATMKGIARTVGQPVSESQPELPSVRPKRPPLWPVFLGASAALALAVFFWFWARTGPSEAALSAAAAASSTSAHELEPPKSPPSVTAAAEPASLVSTASETAASLSNVPTNSVSAPARESASDTPVAVPPPQATERTKRGGTNGSRPPVKSARPETTGTPSQDAWDPDSFGGRH